MEAKFFIKGPKMSNQSSNLTSQRMVTESRFMTLLQKIFMNSQDGIQFLDSLDGSSVF